MWTYYTQKAKFYKHERDIDRDRQKNKSFVQSKINSHIYNHIKKITCSMLLSNTLFPGASSHLTRRTTGQAKGHIIHDRPPYSLPAIQSSRYPIIMPTNERMFYSQQQQEQCVHWLALFWDIWMTILLEDYMVACHELSPSKRCNLCLKEQFLIICQPKLSTLNKRNELASSSCRHRNKALLRNN